MFLNKVFMWTRNKKGFRSEGYVVCLYLFIIFPLVSVIVVVGLANLSCCCDYCVNVANKPDKKDVTERTPPSELILFWSDLTSVFQGLFLSRFVGQVGENPWNEVGGVLSIQFLTPPDGA